MRWRPFRTRISDADRRTLTVWSDGELTSSEAQTALGIRSYGELLDRAFAARVSVSLPSAWDRASRAAFAAAFARARP